MDAINYALAKKPNWDNIKNRPFGETVIDTDITGTERIIAVNSNIKEYQISPLPLQIGQKWDMYYIQGSIQEVLYSSNLEVTSQNGDLYLGDIELKSNVFCITKDKMLINTSFLYMLNITSIKVVCVEGAKTETSLKKIDKKFLYNDWNELDNRPFYEKFNLLIDTVTVECNHELSSISGYAGLKYYNFNTMKSGDRFEVIFDGNPYYVVKKERSESIMIDDYSFLTYVGDPYLNEYPFAIDFSKDNNLIFAETSGNHTFVINEYNLKQLDSKFIPYSAKHMIINVAGNADGTLSADKTFEEILKAYNSGALIYVHFYDLIAQMLHYIEEEGVFLFCVSSTLDNIIIVIAISDDEHVLEEEYPLICNQGSMDQNLFLRGDGSWGKLPLSFNDAGELEVTLNGVTKTFVPKG